MFDITPTSRDHRASFRRLVDYVIDNEPICRMCKDNIAVHADHIIPLYLGGSNELENLQPLCLSCHKDKSLIEQGKKPDVKINADGSPKGISNLDLGMKNPIKYQCYACGYKIHMHDVKTMIIVEGDENNVEVYHMVDKMKCGPMWVNE